LKNSDVTVLMPVFNGGKYLREAIDSILTQSHENFTFVIVDDGSTDKTWEVINSFSDKRILAIQNSLNLGIVESLNRGIEVASGEFIFRMDADDISHPERIKSQLSFMEFNKLDWCGTEKLVINQKGQAKVSHLPKLTEIIKKDRKFHVLANLCSKLEIAHGSVAFRRSFLLEANLRYASVNAEDFRLWLDFLRAGAKMGFLASPLYSHRRTDGLYLKNRIEINSEARAYHREAVRLIISKEFRRDIWGANIFSFAYNLIRAGVRFQSFYFLPRVILYSLLRDET
jgi:glycosyltransferase involved in cell wall biosynthesis